MSPKKLEELNEAGGAIRLSRKYNTPAVTARNAFQDKASAEHF